MKIGYILIVQALVEPITKTKRKSLAMVLSLLHHETSLLFKSKTKNFKYFSIILLITITLNQFQKQKMKKKTKEFLKKLCELSQIFEQSENLLSCDYYIS